MVSAALTSLLNSSNWITPARQILAHSERDEWTGRGCPTLELSLTILVDIIVFHDLVEIAVLQPVLRKQEEPIIWAHFLLPLTCMHFAYMPKATPHSYGILRAAVCALQQRPQLLPVYSAIPAHSRGRSQPACTIMRMHARGTAL